jgi:hypothetical protein
VQHQHRRRLALALVDIVQAKVGRDLVVVRGERVIGQAREALVRRAQYFHLEFLAAWRAAAVALQASARFVPARRMIARWPWLRDVVWRHLPIHFGKGQVSVERGQYRLTGTG